MASKFKMIHRRTSSCFFALVLLMAFTGCASRRERELNARKAAYEQRAATIQPGMTRHQLYAALPPKCVPVISDPGIIAGSRSGLLADTGFQTGKHVGETYALDDHFWVRVHFKLKRPRSMKPPPLPRDIRNPQRAITAKDIDAILLGFYFSKQDMRDTVLAPPSIIRSKGGFMR